MIFYAIICRIDGTILVEGTSTGMEGNFPQITSSLVEFLKEKPVPISSINLTWESPEDAKPQTSETTTMQCELYDGGRRTFVNSNDDHGFFCGVTDILSCAFGGGDEEVGSSSSTNDRYYFHAGREGNLMFICLADDMSGKRHQVNFAFLEEMHSLFTSKYSKPKIRNANSYAMEKSFSHIIRSTIHMYNTNPLAGSSHSVASLQAKVEDMKNVLGHNIYIMLQRGNNIEKLVNKAEMLEVQATVFHKKSKKIKKEVKKKGLKFNCYIVTAVLLVILLISYTIASRYCGVLLERCIEKSA